MIRRGFPYCRMRNYSARLHESGVLNSKRRPISNEQMETVKK